jgi:hypothetical protein
MSNVLLKIALPFAIILGGLMVTSSLSFGKAEYTKKEKKVCTVCHVASGKKDLNDVGNCYAKTHSLEGCEVKK